MRFPDLLIQVKRLEERARLLDFELRTLRQDLIRAFPEARLHMGLSTEDMSPKHGPSEGAAATVKPARKSTKDGGRSGDPTLF